MDKVVITTTLHDVFDPLTQTRRSVQWRGRRLMSDAGGLESDGGRDIDGSEYWILPAVYDADAHMPMVPFGVRCSDTHRAVAGGVARMNVALPWHLARHMAFQDLVDELTRFNLPEIIPLLAVYPNDESKEFPSWLDKHKRMMLELLPSVCKLYSMDPHFERNVDAVLNAGLTPMIWNEDEAALTNLLDRVTEPMYLRHAISANMIEIMRSNPGHKIQTSPHFMLKLAAGKRDSLTVLPTPPAEEARKSLVDAFLDEVDVVASDHVAPQIGAPTGPGLQTQQHFLPALLTLCEQNDWPLDQVLTKATDAPSEVFGASGNAAFAVVDPNYREQVTRWPRQGDDRAPYEGLALKSRVLLVGAGESLRLV